MESDYVFRIWIATQIWPCMGMGSEPRVEQVLKILTKRMDYCGTRLHLLLEFLETWSLCSREYMCLVILLAFFVLIILLGNLYGYVSHSHWSYCHFTWFECTKYASKNG